MYEIVMPRFKRTYAEEVTAACMISKLALTLAATRAAPTSPNVLGALEPIDELVSETILRSSEPRDSTAKRLERPAMTMTVFPSLLAMVWVASALTSSTTLCKGFSEDMVEKVILVRAEVMALEWVDEVPVYRSQMRLSSVSEARRAVVVRAP
jgi:hypothetical protein